MKGIKGEVSLFFVILVIIGIIIAIALWAIFSTASKTLAPEGETFHTIGCQLNNGLASYGLLKDYGIHLPKVLCKPSEININADDCKCEDFTAIKDSEYPITNLYDKDFQKYTSISSKNGKVRIEFEIRQLFEYNITEVEIYTDSLLGLMPKEITIETKGDSIWDRWTRCKHAKLPLPLTTGIHEIMGSSKCEVVPGGKIAIIFDTLYEGNPQINIPELNITFEDAFERKELIDVLKVPPKISGETSRQYSYDCKLDQVDGECSQEWKKRWVALQLGRLAASCWSMGLEGKRQPGAFACYGGKIENLGESLAGDGDGVVEIVSESNKMLELLNNQTYNDYLPKNKMTANCPNFLPYVEVHAPFLISALVGTPAKNGYPAGSYYTIVYSDLHVLSALHGVGSPPFSDKVVFC